MVLGLKRKKKHEDHVDESWLIPYADILTLLLALFIVLFAASEVDAQKFKAISESFNIELQGGTGILDQSAPVELDSSSPFAELADEGVTEEMLEEVRAARDRKELGEFQERLESYIADKGLSPKIETQLTDKGLMLTISEGVLYQSGSADIGAEARTIASELSELLVSDPPRMIYIEGHTDNVPAEGGEFASNWELSSARAINFMKILLENGDLDPQKFSATGYSEYQPIETNETAEGRAKNRRVEVLISPYQQETEE